MNGHIGKQWLWFGLHAYRVYVSTSCLLRCVGHVFNLLGEDAYQSLSIKTIFENIHKVAVFVRSSSKLVSGLFKGLSQILNARLQTQLLKGIQRADGVTKPKKFINFSPTRWNSKHDMLLRGHQLMGPLKKMIVHYENKLVTAKDKAKVRETIAKLEVGALKADQFHVSRMKVFPSMSVLLILALGARRID